MNPATTNAEMLQAFETDGFVQLPRSVDDDEFAELIANVDRFIKDVVPQLPDEHVFYEDRNAPTTLKQIQQMGDHDPWFHDLFTNSRFR